MRGSDQSASVLGAWRELYRCDDLLLARAVATSIAAMEFDVRLTALESAQRDRLRRLDASLMPVVERDADDDDQEFPADAGPFVIEVPNETWPELAEVLLEIIAEQQEFDQSLGWRRQRHHQRLVLVLGVAAAAEALLIWRLLEG